MSLHGNGRHYHSLLPACNWIRPRAVYKCYCSFSRLPDSRGTLNIAILFLMGPFIMAPGASGQVHCGIITDDGDIWDTQSIDFLSLD